MESQGIKRFKMLVGDVEFERIEKEAIQAEAQAANNAKLEAALTNEFIQNEADGGASERSSSQAVRPTHLPKHPGFHSPWSESDDAEALTSKAKKTKAPHSQLQQNQRKPDAKLPAATRTKGKQAPSNLRFCPLLAVSKYPYKFMKGDKATTENVSQRFFAADKFWMRTWNIYYIHLPDQISAKPLLLVTTEEVDALFAEINKECNLCVEYPTRTDRQRFLLEFQDGEPRPSYLGVSNSRAAYNSLEEMIPPVDATVKGEWAAAGELDDRSWEAWKTKMELALEATKNKNKAGKAKKKEQRVTTKNNWCRQLRRTQRYLGLRMCNPVETKGAGKNLSPADQTDFLDKRTWADKEASPELNPDAPAQFPFDEDVLFISLDVEAFERSHNLVTEIGITTLDVRDLEDVAPGLNGVNWQKKIRARHFRIKEYAHLVNTEFITGCPDRFEKDFGTSEFIAQRDVQKVMAACFKPQCSEEDLLIDLTPEGQRPDKTRNIVVVGHDTGTDINYLRSLGFEITKLAGLIEVLDTSEIYRAMKHETQATSLGGLLYDIGISGWNLHNAGNDAAYTMQALIGIAVKALTNKPVHEGSDHEQRIGAAQKETEERIREDVEEWTLADADDDTDDGGVPIPYQPKPQGVSSNRGGGRNEHQRGGLRGGWRGGSRGGSGRGGG